MIHGMPGQVKRLCQVGVVIMALLACGRAHAAVCTTLASGASQSTIQSALNSCGSGNTVVLGAGTFGPITSTVTIPCGVSLIGPTVPYSQTPNQTATINAVSGGISGGNWGFQVNTPCANSSTSPQNIKYLAWNGEQPSVGGGFLFINPGVSYVNVTNNWLHGMNAPGGSGAFNGYAIMMGGSGTNTISNINILWNYFGTTSSTDCPSAMISGNAENDNGALCGGVAYQNAVTNVIVENNIFNWVEEPIKGAETQGSGWNCNNVVVAYNNVQNYNRIGYEEQCYIPGTSTLLYTQYNNWGSRYGQQQSYDVSDANGCGNSYAAAAGMCETHTDYNVSVQAVQTPQVDVGFEIWGQGPSGCTTHCTTASYNLFQGYIYNGITWAPAGNYQFLNNTFNIVNNGNNESCTNNGGSGYFHPENSPAYVPTCTGNTFSNNITGTTTSVAPTISPASGSFTTSQTVTFTNPGTNRDTNTGIWYTTDGSTPVPGSGTAQYIASGGTIAVSTTTTVKAVGMWGAQNQPTSYPSGYGYVPSAVVSATYTAGTSPTLNSVTLSAAGSVTSIATGASVQMSAACHYNNGTTTSCNTTDAYGNSVSSWNTSSSSIATISSSGLATGVAVGSTNLTAVAAGVTSSPFALSVTAPAVTLSSVTLATTGGVSSIVAGSTNQLIATCHYSDGSTTTCTTTDSHGNAPSSWSSTASTIATVSTGGLVTGVAAGSTNLTAVVAGITSSPALTLSVTAAPPTLTGGYLGTPGSVNTMVVGGTLQFSAYCTYSNSTTTNCSVADMYGNAVTSWTSSNTASVTIGAVGSANPGLATAVGTGTPYMKAYVGSVGLNQWDLTVTAPAVSLTGVSLATTGGVTGLFVGYTNQLVATCAYSDGSTTNCTTTDSHGNVAGSYSSSSSAHATVGASTGLVTGVAAGTTNLTAHAGSFTSAALPLTVLAIPSGVYIITLSGPVIFSGAVRF
jgi:hypothetical protein